MRLSFFALTLASPLLAQQVLTTKCQCDVIVSDDLEYDCEESIEVFGKFVLTDSIRVDSVKMERNKNDKAERCELY